MSSRDFAYMSAWQVDGRTFGPVADQVGRSVQALGGGIVLCGRGVNAVASACRETAVLTAQLALNCHQSSSTASAAGMRSMARAIAAFAQTRKYRWLAHKHFAVKFTKL